MAFNPDAYLKSKAGKPSSSGFDPDAYLSSKKAGPTEGESALRGGLSGIVANFDDEITGGLGAVGRVFGVKNLGSAKPFDPNSKYEMASEPLSMDEIVKAYRENRDAARDEQKLDMSVNPKATIAGNLGGAIFSPVGSLKAAEGASALKTAMKTAALQGAVYGAGASDSDLTKGEVGKFAGDTALGAGTGAIIPPAFEVGKKAIQKGAGAASWLGKKAFSSTFSVPEESVRKYLADPEKINNAKSLAEIKEIADDAVLNLKSAFESGKTTEAEAKEALRTMKEQVTRGLSDKKIDAKDALRSADEIFKGARERVLAPLKSKSAPTDRAFEVTDMVKTLKSDVYNKSSSARNILDESGYEIDLKGAIEKAKVLADEFRLDGTLEGKSMASRLDDYAENLRTTARDYQLKNQPKFSIPIKNESPVDFNFGVNAKPSEEVKLYSKIGSSKVAGPKDRLDQVSSKYLKANLENGHNPDTGFEFDVGEARKVLERRAEGKSDKLVKEYEKSLERLTKDLPEAEVIAGDYKVPAVQAKKMIQGLDPLSEYGLGAGAFDKGMSKAYKQIRRTLDENIKTSVPEYKAAMEPVAKSSALLEKADALFGTPEIAVGKLGRLNTPRGEFDRAILSELEQATGKGGLVTKEADAYAQAQRILKDPQAVQKIERSLPEYQSLRQAMADVAKRNPKWTRAQIEQATASQRRALAEATGKRIFAENKLSQFKGLTPASTETKISSLMSGNQKGLNNREILEKLGKQSGNDFIQMADDLAVKKSFEKSAINGSRNTVLGAAVGFALGGLPGAGAGAALGRTVLDNYGPRVGKSILDGILKVKNNPSVKTIRSLSLPENIKQELERELNVYLIESNSNRGVPAGAVAGSRKNEDRSPSQVLGESRWTKNGIDKLGLQDNENLDEILKSRSARNLIIQASDLPANSKKIQEIKNKILGLEK